MKYIELTFTPTGEIRAPRKGEYYQDSHGQILYVQSGVTFGFQYYVAPDNVMGIRRINP